MATKAPAPQLSKDEVRFLESQLAELPTSKSEAGQNEFDGLLKFSYHQNPYIRTFAKVLWSGFAISRGQLADGSQRFAQARRDATVSAIDASTTKALDNAAAALEAATAPNGSIGTFLVELRDRTNQRLWARVCETAGLPPPSFASIMRTKRAVSADELDADEEAEIAALRKVPLVETPVATAADSDDVDDDDDEEDDDDDGDARPSGDAPTQLQVTISRSGTNETLAELLLAAASDALREVRTKGGTGELKITVSVEGQKQGGGQAGTGGHGRRRRRRRR